MNPVLIMYIKMLPSKLLELYIFYMDVAILSVIDKSKSASKSYFDDWKTLQKLKQLQQVKLVGTSLGFRHCHNRLQEDFVSKGN